ncbi:glutamate-1-semialdehyde 2,1-aminomutase [Desertimonas flava]|uniref:glutamate-1-semialdehyde 2,1-aminomutase n=1 Tax=Desertimonas flava TaxID=2064846 RepID=UPI000E3544CA|nr:glutamate-1-semialdehyde 2,1-aminomutase [Desertimonas flava]
MDFTRTNELGRRLRELVPGGGHTYAKGPDQYPALSPSVLARGRGSHVWDVDGNEFVEYGMGLRAVSLGHAYGEVVQAVARALDLGTNFTRPAAIEVECAERFCASIPSAEAVKFTKDGSTATSAAVKLARKATGRARVAICADQAFFSYDDWFMVTTTMAGGIPAGVAAQTVTFRYNDLTSVEEMFDRYPDEIAAVMLEVTRATAPQQGFLEGVRSLCDRNGAVLVFDEMITGFRYADGGAQAQYGVSPDLSTFGKALSNGFSLAALCGRRELMRYGSRERSGDDVFLLSTTHGAETTALAAAIAVMDIYEREPVVSRLYEQGDKLATGLRALSEQHGLTDYVGPIGLGCDLAFFTRDADGQPSQAFRTLFLQETIRRGVLMPSLVTSYSHSDADVQLTLRAIDGALDVYAKALVDGTEPFLVGPPSRYVFDRVWDRPAPV